MRIILHSSDGLISELRRALHNRGWKWNSGRAICGVDKDRIITEVLTDYNFICLYPDRKVITASTSLEDISPCVNDIMIKLKETRLRYLYTPDGIKVVDPDG